MAQNKRGKQSVIFSQKPVITAWASVAGKKEGEGPLRDRFDLVENDAYFGEKTWEQGEKKLQQLTLQTLASKAGLDLSQIDLVYSGDLLNQCIGSSFTLRNRNIPHLGLYGACSTMAESLLLAAMTVGADYADRVIAMTSSHFASSERQYRFPLGYGGQRTPTAQWTVTGSGAALVCSSGKGPIIESATIGTVTDLGIKDANNMGAAMAPAAFQTICAHFKDLSCGPEEFDLIATGDLGEIGSELLLELFEKEGIQIGAVLRDCGTLVFDNTKQDVHAGGSGCGCSAITLCSDLLNRLNSGKIRKLLFCGTGALLSPTSTQQGLPIPGVCHAVSICSGG
jgi:stage V sporulation protein AD